MTTDNLLSLDYILLIINYLHYWVNIYLTVMTNYDYCHNSLYNRPLHSHGTMVKTSNMRITSISHQTFSNGWGLVA